MDIAKRIDAVPWIHNNKLIVMHIRDEDREMSKRLHEDYNNDDGGEARDTITTGFNDYVVRLDML